MDFTSNRIVSTASSAAPKTPAQNRAFAYLDSLLETKLRVTTTDQRVFVGQLICTDNVSTYWSFFFFAL